MVTESKMRDMIVDALAEDDDASFGEIEPFGIMGDRCMVWADDGTAFQVMVTRNRRRDVALSALSFEQELNGRIRNLTKEIGACISDRDSHAMLTGLQNGYALALTVYRIKRDRNILEGRAHD